MRDQEYREILRNFVDKQIKAGKIVKFFKQYSNPTNYFKKSKIKVGLNKYKDIILQDETRLELGGMNKRSFSMVYPVSEVDYIEDGKIVLVGPEINGITDYNVDFGMLILIGGKELTEDDKDLLTHLNFISNGIEGFLIRSIPRRFWCRVNQDVIKKGFSFEFLGNAIMYLYKEKFKDLIDSIEILFINSYPDSIFEFIKMSSTIREQIREKWKEKVEIWKKRIDCDYDWGCEICPYQNDCLEIKEVLAEREMLDERGNP